jgi:hypothetical protein
VRFWWNRKGGFNTSVTTLIQRVFDWAASAIVVKDSPGQPRYYDEDGNPLAQMTVLAAIDPVNFDAGIQEDDSGAPDFVDYTSELAPPATADVDFFPAGAGVDDAFYFGSTRQFDTINVDVNVAGTGTYTVPAGNWEYWDGTTWQSLTGLTDSTTGFKVAGVNTVVFDCPNDWALTTINSQGPYYFVRARRDGGTVTLDPVGDFATAVPTARPDPGTDPNFFGAHYSGKIALTWIADTPTDTVDFQVWVRTDSVVNVLTDNPQQHNELEFEGDWILVHTETGLADRAEVIVNVGYRPVYVAPTSTDLGTLRIGVT